MMEPRDYPRSKRFAFATQLAAPIVALCVVAFVLTRVLSYRGSDQALIEAVKRCDDRTVEALLAQGVSANTRDTSSKWYRMTAPLLGEERVSLPYPTALTVLAYACFEKDPPHDRSFKIAKALLDRGASTEESYRDGATPLLAVLWGGRTDLARLLIEHGANVNTRNALGETPLMKAVDAGDVDLVRLCAQRGADLNARADGGWTAVQYAVFRDAPQTLAALIALGADINLKDNAGRSPLTVACEEGRKRTAELLKRAGAR